MSLKIAVLTIGSELLNGEMSDVNTAAIARVLDREGFALRESLTVADVEMDIEEALLDLAGKRDVTIVTGGLGPTGDDLTARAAARAFKRRLVQSEEARQQICDYFERLGRPMHPANEKQALLPQRAVVLPNPTGSAPGFSLHHGGKDLYFLPGVTAEMTVMLKDSVLPRLRERAGPTERFGQRLLKVFGLSEPKTEELLKKADLPQGVRLAFGVDFPLVHVKLSAAGKEPGVLLDRAELVARRALGDYMVATGEETLAETVARLLIGSGLTLALAESCTGGLIAKLLTDAPGASAFLERGAVTYANAAKRDWLGVPEKLLAEHGAVSEACALAMARGARRAAGTDLAAAVTGIAGPTGGTPQKPVGTVFIALAAEGVEKVKGYRFSGSRDRIRQLAACMVLDWIRRFAATRAGD